MSQYLMQHKHSTLHTAIFPISVCAFSVIELGSNTCVRLLSGDSYHTFECFVPFLLSYPFLFYRYSALHTAISGDNAEMCELLLRWDARVDELTDENATPLQLACATPGLKNRLKIIQVLLKHGANPNANSPFVSYSSPFLAPLTEYLRCVTDEVEYDIVHALIVFGAKVHFRAASTSSRARDPHGILHCVQYLKPKPEVLHLLVEAATGFDVDSIRAYSSLSSEQKDILLSVATGPRSLRTIIHLFLRDYLKPKFLENVAGLPLPDIVKHYLMFHPSNSSSAV